MKKLCLVFSAVFALQSSGALPAAAQVAAGRSAGRIVVPATPALAPLGALGALDGVATLDFSVETAPGLNLDLAPLELDAPGLAANRVAEAVAGVERAGIQLVAPDAELKTRRTAGRDLRQAAAPKGSAAAVFDGNGILPQTDPVDPDLALDPKPEQPQTTAVPRLEWSEMRAPSREMLQDPGTFGKIWNWATGRRNTAVLPGNPRDAEGVEQALRDLIQKRPQLFGGVTPDRLKTMVASKVGGAAGLSDTIYVGFQQTVNGVPVEGTTLHFTVKLLLGKAVVVASQANLYPDIKVETTGGLSEAQAKDAALARLGKNVDASQLLPLSERIMHVAGTWRHLQLYHYAPKVVHVAVDRNTGESFAWDPRHTVTPEGVSGRGIEFDPGAKRDLVDMPLGHIQITTEDGSKFYADGKGEFTVPGQDGAERRMTITLTGRYARVMDQSAENLSVQMVAKAGEKLRAVFNPQGAEETSVAQVTAYVHATRTHDFLVENGVNPQGINQAIPIKTDIDRDCNAYYTPWSPSLNFFKSSSRCINTAYDTVVNHEYGHFVDDMIGGIKNGGLSEGWGDILAIYITQQPIVGESFFQPGQNREYIRHGDNTYQYKASDEVHAQGQAWGGFAWKLHKALRAALGEAEGAAVATALVLPVLFADVRDIPSAIQQVLLRDIDADGNSKHFEYIRDAAAAHNITVRMPNLTDVFNSPLWASLDASPTLRRRLVRGVTRLLGGAER